MPYPNDNKLNVIIAQTSASADLTGKFPFTERIISGSNLLILTDASGSLTGSNTLPSVTITDLTVTTLTASRVLIYDSLNLSGSSNHGSSLTNTHQFTGSVSVTGSLKVDGRIYGTADTASKVTVTNLPNTNATYYVTFVENTGSAQSILTDSNVLSYNPSTNTVKIGDTSGSLLISNDNGTNLNYISLFSDTGGASIQIGQPVSNETASLYVGKNSNGFRVLTGQGVNTGVVTELPITASNRVLFNNTTNATSSTYGGALTIAGGTSIGKDLYVGGSTFLYGDLTVYGSSSVVNISSSTVIIGDNRIVLNAGTPVQRYAGIDVYDSGSGTYVNNVTSSFLWDGLTDNWLLVGSNQRTGTPLTQSSAVIIGGPSGSFGNESLLTPNYLPKAQSSGKNLTNSLLSEDGNTLSYSGNISASQITASSAWIINLSSSFITASAATIANIYSSAISSSQLTSSNIAATFISSSQLTASSGLILNLSSSVISASNASITNIYSNYISSSQLTASNGLILNLSSSVISASNATIGNLYATKISSSQITASDAFIVNLGGLDNISSSRITASNALLLNVYSNTISSSQLTASTAWIVNISSSFITASVATIGSIYSTKISSSQITASDAYFLNLALDNLSASRITASNALITNIFSQNISSSKITASNALLTNVYSNYISSSVISASNLRVELTGSITYATGVLVTYVTGSFNTLTLSTGSYPGNAPGLVPNTPTSSGMPGQINVDNNFIYVYTNQVWKRVPLAQWFN